MDTQAVVTIVPLDLLNLIIAGCLGAGFVEALKHVRKLQGKQVPDSFELVVSIILIVVGGGVAAIYVGQVQSILIAAQIGATAPAIIGAWASGGPPPDGPRGPRAGGGGGMVVLEGVDVVSKLETALRWNAVEK